MEVHTDWFLFLYAPLVRDALKTIQTSGEEGLIPGESARDWVVGSSTLVFLRQLRALVGSGIWLGWRLPGAQELLHAADEDEDPQVHVQTGERWCHMLAPMQTTGLVSTKNVTLMAAAFTVGYGKEVLDEHPSLKVYNVGRENSLVLFENSIYYTVINTKPLLLGRGAAGGAGHVL